MKCPFCTHLDSKVLETRVGDDRETTRRRRECLSCTKRFTTYERVERSPLTVIKKDGRRETFNRDKLILGIHKACERTRVTRQQIDHVLDTTERELRSQEKEEITSATIGNLIAEELKKLDKVAYIRFASVFRRFVEVEEFQRELKKLL
ncbi:MAG TPA: transcriptional regulator NrdR [Patescibacteria group bacterium]|nr:transcriptional regulator NrdR [Patescibacteria group bacterium]